MRAFMQYRPFSPLQCSRLIATLASLLISLNVYSDTAFSTCDIKGNGASFHRAECLKLSVPTQYKGYAPRNAELNILRARARSTPTQDPLIVISGGPGISAVAIAQKYLGFFYGVQKDRDILFIDQRGTGKSQPFLCEEAQKQFDPSNTQAVEAFKASIKQCLGDYPYLHELSSTQAAEDIEFIRKHLGYTQLNLWGSSYGTRVALAYQARFPEASRTVMLDGSAPAVIGLPRYAETDGANALRALFTECQAQSACHSTFGDLSLQWQALLNRLAEVPSKITFQHPRTQQPETITLTPSLIANWVRMALYSRELSALLPLAIHNAAQKKDYVMIGNMAYTAQDALAGHLAYGMHIVMLCHEDFFASPINRAASNRPESNQNTQSFMPLGNLNDFQPLCKHVPALPKGYEADYQPIHSNVPTLLLSGKFDPITPAFWGDWASEHLSNSQHWVVPGGHHGVSGLGCIPGQIARFIEKGSLSELDNTCHQSYHASRYFIDLAGPALNEPKSESHDD